MAGPDLVLIWLCLPVLNHQNDGSVPTESIIICSSNPRNAAGNKMCTLEVSYVWLVISSYTEGYCATMYGYYISHCTPYIIEGWKLELFVASLLTVEPLNGPPIFSTESLSPLDPLVSCEDLQALEIRTETQCRCFKLCCLAVVYMLNIGSTSCLAVRQMDFGRTAAESSERELMA